MAIHPALHPVNLQRRAFEKAEAERKALRDQFAMAALPGIISSYHAIGDLEHRVKLAYEYADMMLSQRDK